MNYSKYKVTILDGKILVRDKYINAPINLAEFMYDFTVKSFIHNIDIYFSADDLNILEKISKYFNFEERKNSIIASQATIFRISQKSIPRMVTIEDEVSGVKKGVDIYNNLVFQISDNHIIVRDDVVDISYRTLSDFTTFLPLIQKLIEGRINRKFMYSGFLPIHGTAGKVSETNYVVLGESHSGKTSYFKYGQILFDEVLYSDGYQLAGYSFAKTYDETADEVIDNTQRKVVKLLTDNSENTIEMFKFIFAQRLYHKTNYLDLRLVDQYAIRSSIQEYLQDIPGKYFFNRDDLIPLKLIDSIVNIILSKK
ncbi:hypothetical protein [Weissella soli]|uniref:Uncharacterized protein n=1 Tax=Weissella soli TaxID=155866 RepID=A0A288Q7A4_9LACO|nr:hypothetical protein [Weissella soli]AOT57137.1 hypothetical protein WSWS_01558 [Weissella soli]NKY83714.1 hypothetical protein [Weissella soli]RDL06739.1 hypothetical protein DFP99_1130 [Weissella soli]GEN93206.1 hypothetical protein WSO01_08180 [Weissella soli]